MHNITIALSNITLCARHKNTDDDDDGDDDDDDDDDDDRIIRAGGTI